MIFDVVHSIPQVAVPLGQVHLDWAFKSGQGRTRRRVLPAISSATDPSGLRRSVRESEPAKREHKRVAAGPKKAPVADLSWTQFFLTPAPPPTRLWAESQWQIEPINNCFNEVWAIDKFELCPETMLVLCPL